MNLKKHGVDFADAVTILDDELAITVSDGSSGEDRYVTIGMGATGTCWLSFTPGVVSV